MTAIDLILLITQPNAIAVSLHLNLSARDLLEIQCRLVTIALAGFATTVLSSVSS